jgi:hypothetical protein
LRIFPVEVMGRATMNSTMRVLVTGELLLAPGGQLSLGRAVAGLLDDEGLDLFAVAGVRNSDDGDQRDCGVLHEHLLELARVDVEPAANDHVLGPVDDEVEAVRVLARQISGAEPTVVDGLRRRLGALVVALHGVVALDRDLPDRAGLVVEIRPVVVDELHLHPGDGPADRADPGLLAVLGEGRNRRRLREPVALEDRHAETFLNS